MYHLLITYDAPSTVLGAMGRLGTKKTFKVVSSILSLYQEKKITSQMLA